MREPVTEVVGGWWRFDRYDVRDGYVRPHPGAKLYRYEPWQAYLEARTGAREPPPYQSLLTLLRELGLSEKELVDRDPRGSTTGAPRNWRTLIERWCAANGLLGSLLHRADLVILAPRWAEERGFETTGVGSERALVPRQDRHLRTNYAWDEPFFTREEFALLHWNRNTTAEGTLVPADRVPKDWPRPTVAIRDLDRPGWNLEPLAKTWARFFPDVPRDERETHAYPAPLTDEFWHAYAEPLDQFLDAAATLARVIYQLANRENLQRTGADSVSPLLDGVEGLHALIAPVSPALAESDDGTLRIRWTVPSLLGSFAMMVLQDLAEGRTVRRCTNCGIPFASSSPRARHHSRRCEATYNQRMWRAREHRKKRQLTLKTKKEKKRERTARRATKHIGRRTKGSKR